jgi:hypothetical protein
MCLSHGHLSSVSMQNLMGLEKFDIISLTDLNLFLKLVCKSSIF